MATLDAVKTNIEWWFDGLNSDEQNNIKAVAELIDKWAIKDRETDNNNSIEQGDLNDAQKKMITNIKFKNDVILTKEQALLKDAELNFTKQSLHFKETKQAKDFIKSLLPKELKEKVELIEFSWSIENWQGDTKVNVWGTWWISITFNENTNIGGKKIKKWKKHDIYLTKWQKSTIEFKN